MRGCFSFGEWLTRCRLVAVRKNKASVLKNKASVLKNNTDVFSDETFKGLLLFSGIAHFALLVIEVIAFVVEGVYLAFEVGLLIF